MQEVKKRVLVVDDEPGVRELLCATLNEDYQVLEAGDGGGALEIARRWQPDLVLLDVAMPGVSGIEVCRELKTRMGIPPAIFLLTALGTDDHIQRGLAAGADSYFVKPFNPRALLERIAEVFGEKGKLIPQVVATQREGPVGDMKQEQLRCYIQDLKRLYEEEHKNRAEMEHRLTELSALNKLFQEHLQQRWDREAAFSQLTEGIKRLAEEAIGLLQTQKGKQNPYAGTE